MNRSNSTAMQTLSQLGASGYRPEPALASVNRRVDQQACTMAVTEVFYLSSLLFFALLALLWATKPKSGAAAGGGGVH